MKKYTTSDIARTLTVSERTARRYIESLLNKENGKYILSQEMFNFIISLHSADRPRTDIGQTSDTSDQTPNDQDFDVIEGFTNEEYAEFQKRLIEYPLLKEQIQQSETHLKTLLSELEYHKKSYLKQLEIHEKLVDTISEKSINEKLILENIQQRNFIEAKEKGLDKDN